MFGKAQKTSEALRYALYEAWLTLAVVALDGEHLTGAERRIATEGLQEALYDAAMATDVTTVDPVAIRREAVSQAVREAMWCSAATAVPGAEYDPVLIDAVNAALADGREPLV